jgi:hypothetical protein
MYMLKIFQKILTYSPKYYNRVPQRSAVVLTILFHITAVNNAPELDKLVKALPRVCKLVKKRPVIHTTKFFIAKITKDCNPSLS